MLLDFVSNNMESWTAVVSRARADTDDWRVLKLSPHVVNACKPYMHGLYPVPSHQAGAEELAFSLEHMTYTQVCRMFLFP